MGSFTESVIAFRFTLNTPSAILGSFVPWFAEPSDPDADRSPPPPKFDESIFDADRCGDLACQLADLCEVDELEGFVGSLDVDELALLWRTWFMMSPMSSVVVGEPGISFVVRWDGGWGLTARTVHKEHPDRVAAILQGLGRFAESEDSDDEFFVGYLKHDYVPFPNLVWLPKTGEPFRIDRLDEAEGYY